MNYLKDSIWPQCDIRILTGYGIVGTEESNEKSYTGKNIIGTKDNNLSEEFYSILNECNTENYSKNSSKAHSNGKNTDKTLLSSDSKNDVDPSTSTSSSSSMCSNGNEGIQKLNNYSECINRLFPRVGYSVECEFYSLEPDIPVGDYLSMLLIPNTPGVKIKFFDYNKSSFQKVRISSFNLFKRIKK